MSLLLLLFCQLQVIWKNCIQTYNFKSARLLPTELIYRLSDWMHLQFLKKKCLNGHHKCGSAP